MSSNQCKYQQPSTAPTFKEIVEINFGIAAKELEGETFLIIGNC